MNENLKYNNFLHWRALFLFILQLHQSNKIFVLHYIGCQPHFSIQDSVLFLLFLAMLVFFHCVFFLVWCETYGLSYEHNHSFSCHFCTMCTTVGTVFCICIYRSSCVDAHVFWEGVLFLFLYHLLVVGSFLISHTFKPFRALMRSQTRLSGAKMVQESARILLVQCKSGFKRYRCDCRTLLHWFQLSKYSYVTFFS